MKSFLRQPLQKATSLLVFSFLLLIACPTFADQFKPKDLSTKKNPPQNWNDPGTWLKLNTTTQLWEVANDIPQFDDIVLIDNGNNVQIIDDVVECKQLTIQAPANNDNPTSQLNIHNNNLRVYGFVLVTGGATQGNSRVAELVIEDNGILEATGDITPNTTTTPINPDNRITLVGTGKYNANSIITPLPVELTSFKATKRNSEVALTWETASEKNNSGYEIQSSLDGKSYETIAFVASKNGNATSAQRYAYSDKITSKEGLVYYRLKQIDLDGTATYYHAKVVDLGRFNYTVSTFPNPFQSSFKVDLETTAAETANIALTDMAGKTVYTAQHGLMKGPNTLEINIQDQPAGIYLLKAVTGNQTYTNRLVKQ